MSVKSQTSGKLDIQELLKKAQAVAANKIANEADPGNYYGQSPEGLSLTGEDEVSTDVSSDAKDKAKDLDERTPESVDTATEEDTTAPVTDDKAVLGTDLIVEGTPESKQPSDPGYIHGEVDSEIKIANFHKQRDELAKIACQLTDCLDRVLNKKAEDMGTATCDEKAEVAGEAVEGVVKEVFEGEDDEKTEKTAEEKAVEAGYKVASAFFDIQANENWLPAIYSQLLKQAHFAERCAEIIADELDSTLAKAKKANDESVDELIVEEPAVEGEASDIPAADVGGEEALVEMEGPGEETISPELMEAALTLLVENGLLDPEGEDLVGGEDVLGAFDDAGLAPEELAMINEKTGSSRKTAEIFNKVAKNLSKKAARATQTRQELVFKIAAAINKDAKVGKEAKKALAEVTKRGKRGG